MSERSLPGYHLPTRDLSTTHQTLLAMALALLALLGNHFRLPLGFGVDYLFGSIAVLLAVIWLGTRTGVIIAAIAGAYTYLLWDHPYALLIFTAEALIVGWQRDRAVQRNRPVPPLTILVALYWLWLGIPCVLLFYSVALDMNRQQVLLIALKQPLNGIANAALAGLIIVIVQYLRGRRYALSLEHTLHSLLLGALLLPTILVGAWQNYTLKVEIEHHLASTLQLSGDLLVSDLHMHRALLQDHPDLLQHHINRSLSDTRTALSRHLPPEAHPSITLMANPPTEPSRLSHIDTGADGLSAQLDTHTRDGRARMVQWSGARYQLHLPIQDGEIDEILILEVNAAPLIAQVQHALTPLLAVLLALAWFGSFIAHALVQWINRPIKTLANLSKDLPHALQHQSVALHPLDVPVGMTETDQLTDAFVTMQHSVLHNLVALEQARQQSDRQLVLLQDSETRLQAILTHSPMGIGVCDDQGQLVFANPALARLVGRDEAHLSKVHFAELTHPEDREREAALYKAMIAGERQSYRLEKRYLHPDDTLVWVDLRVTMLPRYGQQPALSIGMVEDISEIKQAQQQREAMQAELAAAQQRETIGHLASGVAHDFNNLLSVLSTNLYFIKQSVLVEPQQADAELNEVIEDMSSALGQAKVITSGMLSLSRHSAIALQRVELHSTITTLIRILRPVLPTHITLEVDLTPHLWVDTNAEFLQAALLNLLTNGRDAMPKGGILSISTAVTEWDGHPSLTIGQLDPGRYIAVTVRDTGCGMNAETLKHIFKPLFSTKAQQRGHGLGLFMVSGFITQTGAGIYVTSEPEQGSQFCILLPPAA